ncbi:MAG TPA: hypothetical protein VMT22_03640 [Terriglobales bacterium]|nr:hypothetical protein [Terriglobales bacterium]
MNLFNRATAGLTLALALTAVAGCGDNIALVGRPTLELGQEEFVAEVERLDTSSREIHLRPNSSRSRVVGYSADARVLFRGREYPVTQLETGDIVAMQLKQDSRGNSYTDLVRVQESVRDRDQSRDANSRPPSGIQTVDGRVEQVDLQRNSFEMRDQSRTRVHVSLPENAHRSDIDRFNALRSGDYVRVEGRFLDRERFELDAFVRDNR